MIFPAHGRHAVLAAGRTRASASRLQMSDARLWLEEDLSPMAQETAGELGFEPVSDPFKIHVETTNLNRFLPLYGQIPGHHV